MRLKIKTDISGGCILPFRYQYELQQQLTKIIMSSKNNTLFNITRKEGGKRIEFFTDIIKKQRLFTFSKLYVYPKRIKSFGFSSINRAELIFSTPLSIDFMEIFCNLFCDKQLVFLYKGEQTIFKIKRVDIVPDVEISNCEYFITKSPIVTSTIWKSKLGKENIHYFNYMQYNEREKYVEGIKESLICKYELIYKEKYRGSQNMNFTFDKNYITKKQNKISKLIHINDSYKIKSFEAPFQIKADPRLIKIGYDCGFGDMNFLGFGCADYK